MSTTHGSPELLHRAAVVAQLRADDANMNAVKAREKAKSMLDQDLAASLQADKAYHYLARDARAAEEKYRTALREHCK